MGYGRFVGRVGVLAVALGIGLAGPAVATADPSDESSTSGAGPDNAPTGAAKTGAAAEAAAFSSAAACVAARSCASSEPSASTPS